MKYTVSIHAAERYMARFKKSINVYEAANQIQELMKDVILLKKHGHAPSIKYLLNIAEKAILVVNEQSKVVITVYGVRRESHDQASN